MTVTPLTPKKALNKAFLKVKPIRTEIEGFKAQLMQLVYQLYGLTEAEIAIIEGA